MNRPIPLTPTKTLLAALLLALIGCVHPKVPETVTNPNPVGKIPGDVIATEHHDLSAIPQLITDLQSDDAAVRLYAIHALKKLTGQTLGYRYYDTDDNRAAAVQRWQQWSNQQSDNPATQPAR